MSDAISRRAFAERLALAAAAPLLLGDVRPADLRPVGPVGPVAPQAPQTQEPSALAKALAEGVRLRYPDRFTPDELATITRSIDTRLRAVERLYQTTLTNADEPDFVYAVYRGEDA
ncbi:MAG TPA: hypothetical protein VGQ06_07945 [Gemmatimonadales bacterium]|jgi:hypothetical protein|nr:hypothetical protein [Gemmatimonadales bacterium]